MKQPVLQSVEPGTWELLEGYRWRDLYVPAGFITDLDSVPRIPFVYSRWQGRTVAGALVHDYLYHIQETSREMADKIFLTCMADEGVSKRYRYVIYFAVRVFGWFAWWRNQ